MKTCAILGRGGSFGIHTAFYPLHNINPKRVVSVGRQSRYWLDSGSSATSAGSPGAGNTSAGSGTGPLPTQCAAEARW